MKVFQIEQRHEKRVDLLSDVFVYEHFLWKPRFSCSLTEQIKLNYNSFATSGIPSIVIILIVRNGSAMVNHKCSICLFLLPLQFLALLSVQLPQKRNSLFLQWHWEIFVLPSSYKLFMHWCCTAEFMFMRDFKPLSSLFFPIFEMKVSIYKLASVHMSRPPYNVSTT